MDNGRRSFIQGRDILSNVIAGYTDALASNSGSVVGGSLLPNTDSTFYSETIDWSTIKDKSLYSTNSQGYSIWVTPKYVGYWELVPAPAAFRISRTSKPNWLHRKMAKIFFGWTWHDGKLF